MTDPRIVVVGACPGPGTRSDCPMLPYPMGSSGYRLATMFGGRAVYMRATVRVNLIPQHRDPWPVREAADAALNLGASVLDGRRVLLCGRAVAAAFGAGASAPLCKWVGPLPAARGACVAILPHPSARNRWYNVPENEEAAREFLRTALELVERTGDAA